MIPPSNNVMKDSNGKWRTYSLFWEHRQPSLEYFWCLKDTGVTSTDGEVTLPSLKEIYLSYNHIPGYEYKFATEVIGSWTHWTRLCNSGLKGVIAEWKEELEIKLKASSMVAIINTMGSGGDSSRLAAAKYLSDKGYAPTRGRPSKLEKERMAKIDAGMRNEIEDDLERVGLTSIKGGK